MTDVTRGRWTSDDVTRQTMMHLHRAMTANYLIASSLAKITE